MRCKLDVYDLEIIRHIEDLLKTDFKIGPDDTIEVNSLLSVIEELFYAFKHLIEEINEIEEDRDENYKPIPVSDQVGISDKDFL